MHRRVKLIPTSLTLNANKPLGFGGVRYLPGRDYVSPALAKTLSVYEGIVVLWADLLLRNVGRYAVVGAIPGL